MFITSIFPASTIWSIYIYMVYVGLLKVHKSSLIAVRFTHVSIINNYCYDHVVTHLIYDSHYLNQKWIQHNIFKQDIALMTHSTFLHLY